MFVELIYSYTNWFCICSSRSDQHTNIVLQQRSSINTGNRRWLNYGRFGMGAAILKVCVYVRSLSEQTSDKFVSSVLTEFFPDFETCLKSRRTHQISLELYQSALGMLRLWRMSPDCSFWQYYILNSYNLTDRWNHMAGCISTMAPSTFYSA